MLSDIEIANAATLRPIREVAAETLGIDEQHLVPYGHYKAKVDIGYLASLEDRPLGRLVLMTALSLGVTDTWLDLRNRAKVQP